MIIDKVSIKQFRGIKEAEFSLGEHVTLIAGQNGTQKSTLLGILSQTFTIPSKDHPFSLEKPLSGGNYRSSFSEKFRLSPDKDKPGEHEWTLYFKKDVVTQELDEGDSFTVESIPRGDKIRFWKKGSREAGDGYVNIPVIYLSLKRLIPIAEAGQFKETDIVLSDEEKNWFSSFYNKILITNENISEFDYLETNNKNTLGVSTALYDWHSNSSGQDNVGKILLAVLSFMRLKKKYPKEYKGGILAIDELDATLYPGSQIKLMSFLSKFCSDAKIQIVATTHSSELIKKAFELKSNPKRKKQYSIVFLQRFDGEVDISSTVSYQDIINNLQVSLGVKIRKKAVPVYVEDNEAKHFLRSLIGNKFVNIEILDISLGCGNYINLAKNKVHSFIYPNSIVVLDGDASDKLLKSRLKNFILLPGKEDESPEILIARYLNELSDRSPFWKKKTTSYSKQVCFSNYTLNEIEKDRDNAKKWYNEQLDSGVWGRGAALVYRHLIETLPEEKLRFINDFERVYDASIIEFGARVVLD